MALPWSLMLRKPTPHVAKGHGMHFHTSSNNSFNGYAWSFNFLSKLVDSLIGVLVGVGVNVGPYSRQLNCKHKLSTFNGTWHHRKGALHTPVLCTLLCWKFISLVKMSIILEKWHLVYMWHRCNFIMFRKGQQCSAEWCAAKNPFWCSVMGWSGVW